MSEITTIVFDIGNVLVEFKWEEYLKDCMYDEVTILKISNATVKNKIWKDWDRGIRSEEDMIELCCKQEPDVEKEIRRFFMEFDKVIEEFDYSVELIKQLKVAGYKVYLLSNYSKTHFELSKESFKFIPYVDGQVISYEIHHIKPEPEIYEELIRKYSINPLQAVFLDDLPENLEGAKPFGFHTIQVETYEQILEALRKLGLRI